VETWQTKQNRLCIFLLLVLTVNACNRKKTRISQESRLCEWDSEPLCYIREGNKLFFSPLLILLVTICGPSALSSRGRTQGSQKVTDLGCKGGGPVPSSTCSQECSGQ
jgi:hypothetical protein